MENLAETQRKEISSSKKEISKIQFEETRFKTEIATFEAITSQEDSKAQRTKGELAECRENLKKLQNYCD